MSNSHENIYVLFYGCCMILGAADKFHYSQFVQVGFRKRYRRNILGFLGFKSRNEIMVDLFAQGFPFIGSFGLNIKEPM